MKMCDDISNINRVKNILNPKICGHIINPTFFGVNIKPCRRS